MIKVIIELANDEIKRENEIKNAISDILDCYEIEYEIQTIRKEDGYIRIFQQGEEGDA